MARKSRTGVLKRQREAKKAEKAAHKRDRKDQREPAEASPGSRVATADDLAGYGFDEPGDTDGGDSQPPLRRPLASVGASDSGSRSFA